MKFIFMEEALSEMRSAHAYYESKHPGLGVEFAQEVWRCVGELARYPEASPIVTGTTRQQLTHRFPYHVVYQVREDRLHVIAISHASRKPLYWKDRLREHRDRPSAT